MFDFPTTAAITAHALTKMKPKATVAAVAAAPRPAARSDAISHGEDDDVLSALYQAAAGAQATSLGQLPLMPLGRHLAPPVIRPEVLVGIGGLLFRPLRAAASPASVALAAAGGCHSRLPLKDAIIPIPHVRWDRQPPAAGSHGGSGSSSSLQPVLDAQFGAFLKAAELFDAAAFGLSPQEALSMDPQHRLLLESASELVTVDRRGHTGVGASTGAGAGVGVFIGISWTEYHRLGEAHLGPGGPYAAQGAVLR